MKQTILVPVQAHVPFVVPSLNSLEMTISVKLQVVFQSARYYFEDALWDGKGVEDSLPVTMETRSHGSLNPLLIIFLQT